MAYRLRWHIEIIFKGWKFHLNMVSLVPETSRLNRTKEKYLSLYKYPFGLSHINDAHLYHHFPGAHLYKPRL